MIIFNGTALEQVAPIQVVDIRVSPIQMSAVARQRPITWGADYVRMSGGSRTATIEFALLTDDRETRQNQLAAITRWARSDTPKKLELPNRRGMYLEAICTALPEPSLRQWWESKLRITFTTMGNPYWTVAGAKTGTCGTAIMVLGDAPPIMQIERTVSSAIADRQTYSNGTESMAFSQIPAGNLVIDLNHQTAAVTSGTTVTNIMAYYTFGSTFLIPRTGAQTITGTGTIRWWERYD